MVCRAEVERHTHIKSSCSNTEKETQTMARGYSVKVTDASRELTAKERIILKDTTDAVRLDTATQEGAVLIEVALWAELDIHNEHSDDVDYKNYLIVDKDGQKYITGSESFWATFRDIYDDASELDEQGEKWALKVYRQPSKNRPGKDFITCSLV